MTADVVQLPTPARPRAAELEQRALGGVLAAGVLGPEKSGLRQILKAAGISPSTLKDTRVHYAWQIIERLAEKNREISAATVFSAGRAARLFGDSVAQWLEDLQLASVIQPSELPQLLEDLRLVGRDEALLATLTAAADVVRGRDYRPDAVLDKLREASTMLLEPAGDITAASDLIELLDARDRHIEAGTSTLVTSGLKALDGLIGGFSPTLVALTGQPGAGKTGTEASMMRGQLESDPSMRLGLFSLEDGKLWLSKRWLAEDSGILLREVAWKRGTPEEEERLAEGAAAVHPLLERVVRHVAKKIRPSELLRIATGWKQRHDIKTLYIDNHSQFDLSSTQANRFEQRFERLAQSGEDLRAWAEDNDCPVVLLVHQQPAEGHAAKMKAAPPPAYGGTRGGPSIEQKARIMLGSWVRGDAWRLTVLKVNESPGQGKTLELVRHKDAGMVARDGGELVDLHAEAAIERRQRAKEADLEREKLAQERAARRAAEKEKPAAEKPAEAQAALPLGGDDAAR